MVYGPNLSQEALYKLFIKSIENKNIEDIRYCIEQGVDVNKRYVGFGLTYPFTVALGTNDTKIVSLLLDNGVQFEPNSIYSIEDMIYLATQICCKDVVNLLLDKVEDINQIYKLDGTLLHVAAKRGQLDIVQLLIDKGANIHRKDRHGNSPLHWALNLAQQLLLEKEPDGFKQMIKVIKLLITNGAHIHNLNNDGKSAYMLADKALKEIMLNAYRELICKEISRMVVLKDMINPRITSFLGFISLNFDEIENKVYDALMKVPYHILEACNVLGHHDDNHISKENLVARIIKDILENKPIVTAVENAVLNQCGPLFTGFALASIGVPKDVGLEISCYITEYSSCKPKLTLFTTGFDYMQEQSNPDKDKYSYEEQEAKRPNKKNRRQ